MIADQENRFVRLRVVLITIHGKRIDRMLRKLLLYRFFVVPPNRMATIFLIVL